MPFNGVRFLHTLSHICTGKYKPMTAFLVSQALAGIALLLIILSFQFKSRQRIILCLLFSCFLVAVHFLLLGYWTAASLMLLSTVRFAFSLYTVSKKMMALFAVATVAVTAITFNGWLSVLSCLAVLASTVGSFCKEDKQLRVALMVSACLWISHNSLAGSPAAVCNDVLFLGSSLVGYYRFHIRKKHRLLP